MLKQTLLAFILLLSVFLPAQDKVSELHYRTVVIKTGKETMGADIAVGDSFLQIQTRPEHGANPLRYVDRKNDLLVMAFNSAFHKYIIERLDSVYRENATLEPTGEKQKINGYNCEKFLLIEKPVSQMCGMNSFFGRYIWITNDLEIDSAYSLYISHAIFAFNTNLFYKGVIVKAELTKSYGPKYDSYLILESVATKPELEKDFERPWIKYPDAVCVLPDYPRYRTDGNYTPQAISYTCEDIKSQIARMKALARQVTGIENPKYKHGFEMIMF